MSCSGTWSYPSITLNNAAQRAPQEIDVPQDPFKWNEITCGPATQSYDSLKETWNDVSTMARGQNI